MVAVKVEDMELSAEVRSTKLGEIVRLVFRAGLGGSRGPVVLSGIEVSESIDHCQKFAAFSFVLSYSIAVGHSRVLSTRSDVLFTGGPASEAFPAPLPIVHFESMPSQRWPLTSPRDCSRFALSGDSDRAAVYRVGASSTW